MYCVGEKLRKIWKSPDYEMTLHMIIALAWIALHFYYFTNASNLCGRFSMVSFLAHSSSYFDASFVCMRTTNTVCFISICSVSACKIISLVHLISVESFNFNANRWRFSETVLFLFDWVSNWWRETCRYTEYMPHKCNSLEFRTHFMFCHRICMSWTRQETNGNDRSKGYE